MTVRTILQFPDPRLRAPAEAVAAFDAETHALAADLLDTMRAAPGIGIAAPHIGVARRLIVISLPGEETVRVCINPEIVWASPETARHEEGSIAMPGVSDQVDRPARVRVRYHDLDGAERVEEADGLLGVCFQHEIDQLDGVFWIDRLSRLKRERLAKRFAKLRRPD